MILKNTYVITKWLSSFLNEYSEYTKKITHHRCKIVGIEIQENGKNKLLVKINGIKSQISVPYYPEELVANDAMLCEFSQTDVRTITFYALKNSSKSHGFNIETHYKIISQEFLDNRTLFTFKESEASGETRMFSTELYSNPDLLKKFNFNDVMNIIYTAVQEQTVENLG